MSTHHPTEGNDTMATETAPRRVADVLIAMRRTLIRLTIADLAGDDLAAARYRGIIDGLATGLPFWLRTERAMHKYVGDPARRMIERYGILALRDTNGYRPC